jgi:hypothetical protein
MLFSSMMNYVELVDGPTARPCGNDFAARRFSEFSHKRGASGNHSSARCALRAAFEKLIPTRAVLCVLTNL